MTKYCPDCNAPKPASEFYRNATRPGGLSAYCKPHQLARVKQSKKPLPQRKPMARARRKANRLGAEFDARLMALTVPRGVSLTQVEIADLVGCSHQYISHIEKTALRKLRNYPGLRELIAA